MAIDDTWANNNGIYFGYACRNTQGPPVDPYNRPILFVSDRHICTLGPNGSGKSRRLLLPNLINLTRWSILVVDIKAELAFWTADHRKQAGNEIIYLNPFKALGLPSSGYNPVAALKPESDDFIDDALGLAEALIRVEGREPHWSASAQDLICALIMYSRLTDKAGGSLAHVRELLGQPALDFVKTVEDMMDVGVKRDIDELGIKASRFCDLTPENRELHAILSTAMTQTRWLDSRPIKNDLSGGDFDFSEMKKRPVTVYLNLPANRLGTHSNWLRLIITAAIQKLMKDVRKAKVPVLLMIDEAGAIGELPIITATMAMMRGYGVKLWTVYQDWNQALSIYGDRAQSFIGNAGVLQAFAPQDMTTAEFLSTRTGHTWDIIQNYAGTINRQTGRPDSETLNVAPEQMPTMLPIEIINMDAGYSIMFSHKTKGTVRANMPDPSEMPALAHIVAREP